MTWQPETPDESWDEQLFAQGGHFTQSSHWAAVQQALGRKIYHASGDGWQALAVLEKGQLGSRLYCPYGPTVNSLPGLDLALSALKQLAKQLGVTYIRVEPQGKVTPKQLRVRGLRLAPHESQPRFTWVKDLTKDPDQLLAEMTSTNRNLHNTASKKGLIFKESRSVGDQEVFLKMMHQVTKLTGIKPHSDHEFNVIASTLMPRGAAKLYFAIHQNKPLASALIYDSPTTRYYAHAANYHEARKLHPGSPLLTRMILDAKAQGQKEFDFFGVAPPNNPKHRWAGFSRFKQSFGGQQKEYLGTWELPAKPLRYVAYRLAHTAKRMLP